jgi:hypothetical protein
VKHEGDVPTARQLTCVALESCKLCNTTSKRIANILVHRLKIYRGLSVNVPCKPRSWDSRVTFMVKDASMFSVAMLSLYAAIAAESKHVSSSYPSVPTRDDVIE